LAYSLLALQMKMTSRSFSFTASALGIFFFVCVGLSKLGPRKNGPLQHYIKANASYWSISKHYLKEANFLAFIVT
jgi:hypothetical protein